MTANDIRNIALLEMCIRDRLALIVAAEAAAVAGFTDGVDLIDEDNAGSDLGGLLEQVTDAAGAHAHEHLHKVGTGDRAVSYTHLDVYKRQG